MSQNRPDLIKRFVGVASNIIAHKILIKAELLKRVDKGYNADMSKIDGEIDNFLKEQNVG